jgi:hypothetical protein
LSSASNDDGGCGSGVGGACDVEAGAGGGVTRSAAAEGCVGWDGRRGASGLASCEGVVDIALGWGCDIDGDSAERHVSGLW